MKTILVHIIKGIAMGAANVIPGVSGGTIALITGIFERLINAIKSFDGKAVKYLLKFDLKAFATHTDLIFLISIFAGVGLAIVSLAKLFDFLFTNYPAYIWSFFFGLVLASVYFVGKTVQSWNTSTIISFIAGTAIAAAVTFMTPATENDNFFYLILCGVVAICSMILPGLSGSFVLILLGNYQLVAIEAINNRDLTILFPVLIGAVVGLIAFSHFLSWLLKSFKDQTISLLTGFILGSLSILWPWKEAVYLKDTAGELLLQDGFPKVARYIPEWPAELNQEVMFSTLLMIAGILTIWAVEFAAQTKKSSSETVS
jgi:putative membrane protein